MCGILGILTKENSTLTPELLESTFNKLFKLSESRGRESSGVAILSSGKIRVYKKPLPASFLITTSEYKKIFKEALDGIVSIDKKIDQPIAAIAHTRLVTDGVSEFNQNNQPVIKDGLVAVHNGIIVNTKELWQKFADLKREYHVDTEIFLSLFRFSLEQGKSLTEAAKQVFSLIKGSVSLAILFNDFKYLLLATNTGSLYFCLSEQKDIFIFSSELYLLKKLIRKKIFLRKILGRYNLLQLKPQTGLLIGLDNLIVENFHFDDQQNGKPDEAKSQIPLFEIVDLSSYQSVPPEKKIKFETSFLTFKPEDNILLCINSLKRCTRCILPETMPFIEFDEKGVCNYCHNHKKIELKGEEALKEFIIKYRNVSGEPDCLVAFSGGRDSSYGLHYIKNILKLNPIAYSYDWGMITDLARRNQARLCGQLGIEHIVVSADIRKKRENIKKNVLAWLKKPNLGLIPLFMAGDKQYFYHANRLRKENKIKLIIYCENPYEKTDFKFGFCGVMPKFKTDNIYNLPWMSKIRLFTYYGKEFLFNPAYINKSLLDTLDAYICFHLISHQFLLLYHYIPWNEKEILSILTKEYDWETDPGAKTTWRIGDGTAAFYNYIYYILAGFTENDTFRSNQIREGILTREEALQLVEEENKPRYDSIKWYCDTIGIDFKETLKRINSFSKNY
ncbi:MAG: hypothetical protein V1892_03400 [bacterium]